MLLRKVNRESKVPLYHQLYIILREQIQRGELKPGDMILPESELASQFEVSMITVREALGALKKEGLIYRRRGLGTFVAHPTLEQGVGRIISFTEDMRQRGLKPASRLLSSSLIEAPPGIASKLQIQPGEELARIERLRLADDQPMSVEESYLIHRYCPGILSCYDPASQSLRELLGREYGIRITHAKQVIRAVRASGEQASVLSVPQRSPLLFIERVSYSEESIPIEFLNTYYRADRYAFYGELRG